MSIFISAQDYLTMSNECQQLSFTIYNHSYKMWCKKDKAEQAGMIIEKITPIIEKTANNNRQLSFDKILLISIIDILSKEKEYKQDQNNNNINKNEVLSVDEQDLIDAFMDILSKIKHELDNNNCDEIDT